MGKIAALTMGFALAAQVAMADGIVSYTTEDSFDDVVFGLENAIIDQGLVIDATNHVGDMLDRTGADVGSEVKVFDHAEVFGFCSASLSRKVMEIDPLNLRFCPYDIFVMVRHDAPDETVIGYRSMPEGEMQEVQALLDDIVREAIGLD